MAESTSTKTGHALAKVLGIKLNYRTPYPDLAVSRGESVFSVDSADTYVEEEPTVAEWIRGGVPTTHDILGYVHSLFPFTHWITRYNAQWLIGDLIAGKDRYLTSSNQTSIDGDVQVSRLVQWSSLKAWLMQFSLSWTLNSVFTPHSWVC